MVQMSGSGFRLYLLAQERWRKKDAASIPNAGMFRLFVQQVFKSKLDIRLLKHLVYGFPSDLKEDGNKVP